jgi:preprotein translocase SecE subunit
MSKFFNYIRDTRGEMKHVVWPTRLQVVQFTLAIVIISAFLVLFLGGFDYLFTRGLEYLIVK